MRRFWVPLLRNQNPNLAQLPHTKPYFHHHQHPKDPTFSTFSAPKPPTTSTQNPHFGFASHFGRRVRLLHFSLQNRNRASAFSRFNSWRSFMSNPDVVLYGLIGTNASVFFLWKFADPTFMTRHFTISATNIKNWRLHTIITSAFSQKDADHIFTNMLGLYVFGSTIGELFGSQFLLRMYFAGAVSGSIFYLLHQVLVAPSYKGMGSMFTSSIPGLGASGAVNAIMLFYIFLFPTRTIYFQLFIPLPAILVGAGLIGADLWRVKQGDTRVSGSAHLGGAMVAALVWARMIKRWI